MSSSVGNQVRASHILIKHQGSRRKASWKDPEGAIIKNTTRDSAVSQLKALHDDIISGKAKFDDLASRYSDCSSAKRGGDLGPFGKGQMQKPFEEATFALKVGEISDIVDTDSGVHIIMRTVLDLVWTSSLSILGLCTKQPPLWRKSKVLLHLAASIVRWCGTLRESMKSTYREGSEWGAKPRILQGKLDRREILLWSCWASVTRNTRCKVCALTRRRSVMNENGVRERKSL
ncbi:unnamed protein product [Prunus armeniaca]|uniref:Peptidyl-prolyl cis-trans isomerase n=1 Tax=Prunus armeniaca TaxID=36596 RepID=A0A6J5VYG9_PRUAR|nr:unnamed protein product [Prunus armeniaca]